MPFDELQAEQIQMSRDTWAEQGHTFEPRVSLSRSVIPLVSDWDRQYVALSALRETRDQVGVLDAHVAPAIGWRRSSPPEAAARR